ncbi:MAG TPA: hypothetical protein VE732_01820 [Nitrososphaera sp.]|nr:hypothetical protein [Nitrososphaera sp.]
MPTANKRPYENVQNRTQAPDIRWPLPAPLSSATGKKSEATQSDREMRLKITLMIYGLFIHYLQLSHLTPELTGRDEPQ